MSQIEGPWGSYPAPPDLQLVGWASVNADGTVNWASPNLLGAGVISKTATGNYRFKPPVNIVPRLLPFVTPLFGETIFGVTPGLGPDGTWIDILFTNPLIPGPQDTNFVVVFYTAPV